MTDLLRHLETRRSARAAELAPPGPDAAVLERMLALAARSPDHGKLAPWRFIVFEGEGRARAGAVFADVLRQHRPGATEDELALERGRFMRAPVVVAVVSRAAPHPKIPEREQLLSAAAVTMNLLHAAYALGFRACWLTGWMADDRRCLEGLGLKPHETIVGFVHIGTAPANDERPRPAVGDIVTRF